MLILIRHGRRYAVLVGQENGSGKYQGVMGKARALLGAILLNRSDTSAMDGVFAKGCRLKNPVRFAQRWGATQMDGWGQSPSRNC
jgi:hypothetical protein